MNHFSQISENRMNAQAQKAWGQDQWCWRAYQTLELKEGCNGRGASRHHALGQRYSGMFTHSDQAVPSLAALKNE